MDLGICGLISHAIDTGDAAPIKQPPRRNPLAFINEEKNVIEKMRQQDVIKENTSPWASPIVLVLKKNGKIRPCVDYRRVNAITRKDAYAIPKIQDCLDSLSGLIQHT